MDKVLYPAVEGFAKLGIGRSKGFAEIRAGRLFAVKSGHLTLIPAESLHEYADRLIAEAKARAAERAA